MPKQPVKPVETPAPVETQGIFIDPTDPHAMPTQRTINGPSNGN